MVQGPNEDKRESPNIIQSPKVKQETLCNQQSKPAVVSDEERPGSSWPVGTESWYVHEIKPQRTLCVAQEKQRVSHQDCTLTDLSQHISDTEDEATSDLFWPLGNESWFIHEIKPQREPLALKSCVEKLMMPQSTTNTDKPYRLEDVPGSGTNGGCGYIELQAVKLDDQSKFGMIQRSKQLDATKRMAYASDESSKHLKGTTAIDNQNSKCKQKLKTTSVRHTTKWLQDRKQLIPDVKLRNSLLPSGFSTRMTRHDCSNNRLLRRLGKAVALLFLFLFSMINRHEVLPDLSHSKTTDRKQCSIVELKLIVNTIPCTSSKRYLERFILYAKTIEILRTLESLLIYAIT